MLVTMSPLNGKALVAISNSVVYIRALQTTPRGPNPTHHTILSGSKQDKQKFKKLKQKIYHGFTRVFASVLPL
jgi:hypothetical protein